jgi:zinc/manganese transport system permease protein
MLIAGLASVSGLSLSYQFDLPSGPAIVLAAGALYLASMLVGPRDGLLRRLARPRHLEA